MKSRTLKRGQREHVWLWLAWRGRIWLEQRPETGVWAGLWSLPEFDSLQGLDAASNDWPGAALELPSFTHVLTHLDWTLHPVRWTLPARTSHSKVTAITARWGRGRWFEIADALAAALPSPLRKLLTTTSTANAT